MADGNDCSMEQQALNSDRRRPLQCLSIDVSTKPTDEAETLSDLNDPLKQQPVMVKSIEQEKSMTLQHVLMVDSQNPSNSHGSSAWDDFSFPTELHTPSDYKQSPFSSSSGESFSLSPNSSHLIASPSSVGNVPIKPKHSKKFNALARLHTGAFSEHHGSNGAPLSASSSHGELINRWLVDRKANAAPHSELR